MSIGSTTLFGMIHDKVNWLNQRHRVLAQNVANANTPNYRAKDIRNLDFSSHFRKYQDGFELSQTNGSHLHRSDSSPYTQYQTHYTHEVSPDGNGVSLEEQVFKLNAVQSEHNLAVSLMRKYHSMYNQALSAPR